MKVDEIEEDEDEPILGNTTNSEIRYTNEKVRKSHKEAYKPWTNDLDDELNKCIVKVLTPVIWSNILGGQKELFVQE